MNKKYLGLLFFALLLLASCKSKKNLQIGSIQNPSVYYAQLFKHNISINGYSAKAGVKIKTDYESLTAKLYIRTNAKDSIWLMGKKLGIEGVRMLLTRDSIFSIDRLARTYFKGPFLDIKYKYGIDLKFDQIHELLIGNILIPKEPVILNTEIDSSSYSATYNIEELLIKQSVDLYSILLRSTKISDSANRTIEIDYGEYQQLDNFALTPYFRNYYLPNTEFGNLELALNFSSIEIDRIPNMPFSIPAHYQRQD